MKFLQKNKTNEHEIFRKTIKLSNCIIKETIVLFLRNLGDLTAILPQDIMTSSEKMCSKR